MHDNRPPRAARQMEGTAETQNQRQNMVAQPSTSLPSRQRSEESWIELGSRPSSSSLSSATDEIITTGLTVQHDSNLHKRNRRVRGGAQFQIGTRSRTTGAEENSSQEEYEESESESDRVMTSSNEAIRHSPLGQDFQDLSRNAQSSTSSEYVSEKDDYNEDVDENATAVNYPRSSRREFQPRPNAFSHPNSPQAIRTQSGTVYTPRRNTRPALQQQQSYPQHTPYNMIAPSYQADHDAALRASLSTLLSAAAAVRGLPKPGKSRAAPPVSSNRVDPTSLRMVPESVALGEISEETASSPHTASSTSEQSKRKASLPSGAAIRSNSRDRRTARKAPKTSPQIEEISPTLMTWVVSAGVVVLVSALSFSAGYVIGKEVGHAEAFGQLGGAGAEAGRCGKEAALQSTSLGLRKQIWAGSTGIRA